MLLAAPPPAPAPRHAPLGAPQVGDALVGKLKYGFTQERDVLRVVDVSADDNDDIPMPNTVGKPVRCAPRRLLRNVRHCFRIQG